MKLEIGEEVELLTNGEWLPATVVEVDHEKVKLRRSDGQYRTVAESYRIRSAQDARDVKATLDSFGELCYNKGMELLQSPPDFNVEFPEGSLSKRLELELLPCTEELNRSSLKVNAATHKRNREAVAATVDLLTKKCQKVAGWSDFRPNAPSDCKKVFLEQRKLTPFRVYSKSGQSAMDKETLAHFANGGDELAPIVIEAREAISKLSQLDAWEKYAAEGRVQATWNQLGTPHGRYSCDSPNLQNRITEIRETIEAEEGSKLLSLDLGQAEYVVWASLSQDPLLKSIFKSGADLHATMIEEILKVVPNLDLRGVEPRAAGKTINFALLYLMQPFSLAQKLGCTTEEATRIIDGYRSRAPDAVEYIQQTLREFHRAGAARTKFGRVRQMPDLMTAKGNPKVHQLNKTAWHHHNAGTAAEILKIKQVRAWKALREVYPVSEARFVMQMHDEVILEVKDEHLEQVIDLMMRAFTRPIAGFLDFKIDQRTGQNWLQISK